MTAGIVEVDVSQTSFWEDPGDDRRALAVLFRCPDGATVRLRVGSRQYISNDFAYIVHQHIGRLRFEIIGNEPDVVRRFVDLTRGGEPWPVEPTRRAS